MARDGSQEAFVPRLTRADIYDAIRYFDYEALDGSIVKSAIPAPHKLS